MSSLFRKRLSAADERLIIIEEATYLMDSGYRQSDYAQIMDGMYLAVEQCSDDEWKNWAELPLKYVIDDFFHYGVP